jgi:hypothetical protein
MTYLIHITSGPLAGRNVTVIADDDWQAAKRIADAIGIDVMNCADWPVYYDTATLDMFASAPQVETITLNEALSLLNNHLG